MTGQPSEAALAQINEQIMLQATLDGINFSFLFATGLAFVALILSFFIKRADSDGREAIQSKNTKKSSYWTLKRGILRISGETEKDIRNHSNKCNRNRNKTHG